MEKKQPKEFWIFYILSCVLMFGFAYYQNTTVLYIIKQFNIPTDLSYEINGVFSALVYLSSVFGGYFAQKYADSIHGLITGLFLYALGALFSSLNSLNAYLIGLAAFAAGYGFIYTNLFYLLEKLYVANDPRRESGFTLAYMGFNVGAVIGFMLGGFAIQYNIFPRIIDIMAVVFVIICIAAKFSLSRFEPIALKNRKDKNHFLFYLYVFIIILIMYLSLRVAHYIQIYLLIVCAIMLLSIFGFVFKEHKNKEAAKKLFALGILTVISVIFWTVYKMQDNLILHFFESEVNRKIGNIIIPAPSILSIDPIVILLVCPVLSLFWIRTGNKYNKPSKKTSGGLLFFGLSFMFLIVSVAIGLPINLLWASLFIAGMGIAESILGPGTISMVGQLAEEKYHVILLGLTELNTATASIFSGQLAVFFHHKFLSDHKTLQTGYLISFSTMMLILFVGAIGVWFVNRLTKSEL